MHFLDFFDLALDPVVQENLRRLLAVDVEILVRIGIGETNLHVDPGRPLALCAQVKASKRHQADLGYWSHEPG